VIHCANNVTEALKMLEQHPFETGKMFINGQFYKLLTKLTDRLKILGGSIIQGGVGESGLITR
jgi:hypothetical protein